jgi:TolA-binding protein
MTCINVTHADELDNDYEFAMGLYRQQRWQLSAESFQAYLKKAGNHPRVPNARLYAGQSLVNAGKYQDARVILREFVKLHPENKNLAQAKYRVGECSYFLDEYPAAVKELREFLQVSPEDPLREWAYPYLADAELKNGNPQKAREIFELSVKTYPQGALIDDSYYGLARSAEQLKDIETARKIYLSISNTPNNTYAPSALLNLAFLAFDARNYLEAQQLFNRFIASYPKHQDLDLARINAGFSCYHLGEYAEANQLFASFGNDSGQKILSRYWEAITFQTLKQDGKAEQILEDLLALKERQTQISQQDLLFQLAGVQINQNKFPSAKKTLGVILEKYPEFPETAQVVVKLMEISQAENDRETINRLESQYAAKLKASPQANDFLLIKANSIIAEARPFMEKKTTVEKIELVDNQAYATSMLAGEKLLQKAIALLNEAGQSAQLSSQLRPKVVFSLMQAYLLGNKPQEAMKVIEAASLSKENKMQVPDLFVMEAMARYQSEQFVPAITLANEYLQSAPQGTSRKQAYEILLFSLIKAGKLDDFQSALKKLASEQSGNAGEKYQFTYRLAEALFAQKLYVQAKELYQSLANQMEDKILKTKGQEGLAWSLYEGGEFAEAHRAFMNLKQQADTQGLKLQGAQATYVAGLALVKENKLQDAFQLLREGFLAYQTVNYPPDKQQLAIDQGFQAYHCAREAARAANTLKQRERSEEMYLGGFNQLKILPVERRDNLDRFMDEWALLHYESGNYARADEIYRMLIQEVPQSSLADNAQLILGESDFIAGKYKSAREIFTQLVQLKAADAGVKRRSLYQLVTLSAQEENWSETIKLADYYAANYAVPDPEFLSMDFAQEIKWRKGQALLESGGTKEGLTLLKEVLNWSDAAPGIMLPEAGLPGWGAAACVHLAEGFRREKDYLQVDKLLGWFETAYAKSSYLGELKVVVGRCKISQAQFEQARKYFEEVITQSEGKKTTAAAQAQFYIAETYLMQKNHEEGLRNYLKVPILYANEKALAIAATYQVGQCEEVLGRPQQALKAYEEVVKSSTDNTYLPKAQERITALKNAGVKAN